jgi:hypothetical protein
MAMMARPRWQFGLRTLLIAIVVFAVLFACYREMVGRLEFEGPISSGHSPTIFFVPSNPDEVRGLNETFDQRAFMSVVEQKLDAVAKQHRLDPIDFNVYVVQLDEAFCFKYDYYRWGRSRFDVLRLGYVFDVTDPVAQARNDAVEQAVFAAAKEWAITQPAVVQIEHRGRMHQIVTKKP